MVTDSVGSFGVLLAAGILQLTGWTPVNAVVTLFIAALMVLGGWGVVRDTVRVLLEGAPAAIWPEDLTRTMEAVGGVDEVHDLHVWTVSSDQPALACHVTLSADAPPAQKVLCQLHDALAVHGINHCTIQIETREDMPNRHGNPQ